MMLLHDGFTRISLMLLTGRLKHSGHWPSVKVNILKLSTVCNVLAVHVCSHYVYTTIYMTKAELHNYCVCVCVCMGVVIDAIPFLARSGLYY